MQQGSAGFNLVPWHWYSPRHGSPWFSARWLILAIWFGMVSTVSAGAQAAVGDAFFDTGLGDFAAELKTAQQEGKQGVLLVFEAEGCPFCHRMREQILSQTAVQQYFRRYFSIHTVDINGSVLVTDFAGKELTEKNLSLTYKARGTPTFVFVGIDGQVMARHVGATKDVDTFMALGRYVVEGHWKKGTFEHYRGKP